MLPVNQSLSRLVKLRVMPSVVSTMMSAVIISRLVRTISATLSHILVRALPHTGIIAVAVRMIITAIALASMGVMPTQCTSFHMTDPDYAAGAVTIAMFMGIAAVRLAVMGVKSRLCTAFHRTDPDHTAGAVTIAACMIVPAVSLVIVKVVSDLRTPLHRTYADRAAGTVAIASRMSVSTIGCIVMCVQPGSRTTLHRTHGTYRFHRGTCLTMMSMSRHRHNDHSCHQ